MSKPTIRFAFYVALLTWVANGEARGQFLLEAGPHHDVVEEWERTGVGYGFSMGVPVLTSEATNVTWIGGIGASMLVIDDATGADFQIGGDLAVRSGSVTIGIGLVGDFQELPAVDPEELVGFGCEDLCDDSSGDPDEIDLGGPVFVRPSATMKISFGPAGRGFVQGRAMAFPTWLGWGFEPDPRLFSNPVEGDFLAFDTSLLSGLDRLEDARELQVSLGYVFSFGDSTPMIARVKLVVRELDFEEEAFVVDLDRQSTVLTVGFGWVL